MKNSIDDLIELGCSFRVSNPEPGSPEMIAAVERLVDVYTGLGAVTLSADDRIRDSQVTALKGMQRVKRLVAEADWETLGRSSLLYGLRRFSQSCPDEE